MALLHSTVHTSPQLEANTSLLTSRKEIQRKEKENQTKEKEKEKQGKAKEIHITVYTSDEESLPGQEVTASQREKKTGSITMASNDKPAQFKVGEGCFAKVYIHIPGYGIFILLTLYQILPGSWLPLLAGQGNKGVREHSQRCLLWHQGGGKPRPQGPC